MGRRASARPADLDHKYVRTYTRESTTYRVYATRTLRVSSSLHSSQKLTEAVAVQRHVVHKKQTSSCHLSDPRRKTGSPYSQRNQVHLYKDMATVQVLVNSLTPTLNWRQKRAGILNLFTRLASSIVYKDEYLQLSSLRIGSI